MERQSRVKKSLLNMRVNMIAYVLTIFIAFFSRRIFFDKLGAEFIGLTTTANSLLGFLNLAELGVGTSIAYFLYKPIFENDREKINDTISIMGYMYRIIGIIILASGIILSLFLPLIFEKTDFSWLIIYYCFYAELFCSLLGYFVNYKANTIFAADQRQYLVTAYFQIIQFLMAVTQMCLAYFTSSYYLFVTVTLIFAVVNSIVLNWKFNRIYPWVKSDFKRGREALKERPEIVKYIRRVFIHQIGGFVNYRVMPIIMYGFASLTTVALYGNYITILNKVGGAMSSVFGGTGASVGNLIAEGNKEKTYNCYRELFTIKFSLVAFLFICSLKLCNSFVSVWLGKEYLLPQILVVLICSNSCLDLFRDTTEQFLNGFGLKADIWVPVCRVASLALIVLAGYFYGLTGMLFVPVTVQILLMHIWKPYYLYHSGFKLSFAEYLKVLSACVIPFVIAGTVAELLTNSIIGDDMTLTWRMFFYKMIIFTMPLALVSIPMLWFCSIGFRMFVNRTLKMIRK